MNNKEHRIMVTGTGRSFTSLLMAIFTYVGWDTGFTEESINKYLGDKCGCGMEDFYRNAYIIKRPMNDLVPIEAFLTHFEYDLLIIPIRNLYHASQSRVRIHKMGETAGGLTHTRVPEEQYNNSAIFLGELVSTAVLMNIPMLFIKAPLFLHDFEYLWETIYSCPQLHTQKMDKKLMHEAWEKLVDLKKIHF